MLFEQKDVKQNEGEPFRRVFIDDYFDLYVWISETNEPIGFQLCYEKTLNERALSFINGNYSHTGIENGDNDLLGGIPLLMADGEFGKYEILKRFIAESNKIDSRIRNYVINKIKEYDKNM